MKKINKNIIYNFINKKYLKMIFDFIRGGQILTHTYEMLKQVIRKLFTFSLIITFVILSFKFQKDFDFYQIKNTFSFILAEHYVKTNQLNKIIKIDKISFSKFNNHYQHKNYIISGKSFNSNINSNVSNYSLANKDSINLKAVDVINNKILKYNKIKTIEKFKNNIFLGFIIYFLSFSGIITIFLIKGYLMNKDKYLRGAKIVSLRILNNIVKKYNRNNRKIFKKNNKINFKKQLRRTEYLVGFKLKHYDYRIANAIYPIGSETIHTIITGASGTGKTVLITDLINQIRKNGDRAIIYDRMGTFVSKFYNGEEIDNKIQQLENDNKINSKRKTELKEYYNLQRDTILNPLDERSPYWSIFNEVRDGLDFDNIANALIPENAGNIDPFWNVAARILFSSVANKLRENNQASNKDLIDKLLKIDLREAAALVRGTPAQSIIDEQNPKTALSVMAMISTNLKSLIHLKDKNIKTNDTGEVIEEEKSFSIRKWIQNDDQEGFLFISSRADRHETLKPLITTWLDIAINSLLSLEQSTNRKIWIIIDELPSLYYLPSLHTGLAESRQFGGCFVLSMQLMAQLRSIYGREKAESTSGLCRNRIILNTPDEDTAKWCSDNLGRVEIKEVKESISFGANDYKDGVNINQQEIQKNIVLPTEIMQLNNLNAYIKFAGDFPIALSKFKYKHFSKKGERYVESLYKNNITNDKFNQNKNLEKNLNQNNIEEKEWENGKEEDKNKDIKILSNQEIDLFD